MSLFFTLLDTVWTFAVIISKYVFIVLLLWSLYLYTIRRPLAVLHQAFVRELVKKGEYIVFGTVLAGLGLYATGSFIVATILFISLFALSFWNTQSEPNITLSTFKYALLSVIIIAAIVSIFIAIAFQSPLFNHAVAVFLYAILFWQV